MYLERYNNSDGFTEKNLIPDDIIRIILKNKKTLDKAKFIS